MDRTIPVHSKFGLASEVALLDCGSTTAKTKQDVPPHICSQIVARLCFSVPGSVYRGAEELFSSRHDLLGRTFTYRIATAVSSSATHITQIFVIAQPPSNYTQLLRVVIHRTLERRPAVADPSESASARLSSTRLVPLGCRSIDAEAPASFLNSCFRKLLPPSIALRLPFSLDNYVNGSGADPSLSEQVPSFSVALLDSSYPANNAYCDNTAPPQDICYRLTPLVRCRFYCHFRQFFTLLDCSTGGVQSLLSVFVAVKHAVTNLHSPLGAHCTHKEISESLQSFDTLSSRQDIPPVSGIS